MKQILPRKNVKRIIIFQHTQFWFTRRGLIILKSEEVWGFCCVVHMELERDSDCMFFNLAAEYVYHLCWAPHY